MLHLFKSFKTTVLDKKVSHEQMVRDVSMMKFKIRPLQGDVMRLNFANATFVETIWQLGMMDELSKKISIKSTKIKKEPFLAILTVCTNSYKTLLTIFTLMCKREIFLQNGTLLKWKYIKKEIVKSSRINLTHPHT